MPGKSTRNKYTHRNQSHTNQNGESVEGIRVNNWKVTSGPSTEPVTATEAKLHCKVDNTADDALFTILIQAAREYVEQYCNIALVTETITEYFDAFPAGDVLTLSVSPLQTVTSITYVDSAGATQTLSSGLYNVDTAHQPARVFLDEGQTWPETYGQRNCITVVYTAGFGAAAAVPAKLKLALLMSIAERYNNRQDGPKTYRTAVEVLLDDYKIRRW